MTIKVDKSHIQSVFEKTNIFIFAAILMLILNTIVPATMAAGPSSLPAQSAGDIQKVPILIKFKSTATSADIDNAIQASGGEKGRKFGQIRTHIINVPANAADRILAAYAKHASVERATSVIG